jgi:acyl carrier protein
MFLQAAPLTPSGKLDTRSLPLPHMSSVAEENAGGQDHSIESIILCTWQQVLVNEEIGLDDNFFEAGGNSFLLLQARQKLCDELAINISVPDMLRFATVRALSEALKAGLQAETSIQ